MSIRVPQFIAIVLTALALVPSGAHVLEVANKIGLDREHYIIVQQIYQGWARLGIILIAAVIANGLVAIMMRSQAVPMLCPATAAVLICVGLAVFFTWTFPVNQATHNWTVAPENWQALRTQWEYSHAVNAFLTLLALCATTAGTLVWTR